MISINNYKTKVYISFKLKHHQFLYENKREKHFQKIKTNANLIHRKNDIKRISFSLTKIEYISNIKKETYCKR